MQRCCLSALSLLVMSIACTACTPETFSATPIDECVVGEECVVEGQLIATKQKGRIEDDSDCIAVALPESVGDNWNLTQVRATGRVYRAPDAPGLVTYKIQDRDVDAEACYSGYAMYVDDIEQLR